MAKKVDKRSQSSLEQEKIRQEIASRKKEYQKYKADTRKEAKRKQKELREKERSLKPGRFSDKVWGFFMVLLILLVWLFILAVAIKYDAWGIGTKLSPFLERIPNGYLLEP